MKFVLGTKKKSVLPPPVEDDDEEERPVSKKKKAVALTVIEGGKGKTGKKKKAAAKAKTTTKVKVKEKVKKAAKAKGKVKRASAVGKSVAEDSPALQRLIGKADAAFGQDEAVKEKINEALGALYDFLKKDGKSSFKHPKLGYYSVMKRGKIFFWRPKPQGRG